MTKAERNDAIVKMYRGGYTQEAIGEMFGIVQAQIGYIVGAEERVERLSLSDNSQKLSTANEQVLRKAPDTTLSFSQEVICSGDLQLHAPHWPEANKPHGKRLSHANREEGLCEDILVDKVVLGVAGG